MNYPIPNAQVNTAYFYVNSSNNMGSFSKPIDGRVQISVDYSGLTPAVLVSKVWFEIDPGGVPPLTIDNVVVSTSLVTFVLGGGWADTSYNIIVNAVLATGEVHSDLLVINVYGEGSFGCLCAPLPSQTNQISGFQTFINTALTYYISGKMPDGTFAPAPNLMDWWYDTNNGLYYVYVSNGVTSFWSQINLGAPPPVSGGGGISGGMTIMKMQPITPNGTRTTFTLTGTDLSTPNVTTDNSLFVSIDGVWQEPTTQFTATGNSITFVTAPAADSYIFILWIYGGLLGH